MYVFHSSLEGGSEVWTTTTTFSTSRTMHVLMSSVLRGGGGRERNIGQKMLDPLVSNVDVSSHWRVIQGDCGAICMWPSIEEKPLIASCPARVETRIGAEPIEPENVWWWGWRRGPACLWSLATSQLDSVPKNVLPCFAALLPSAWCDPYSNHRVSTPQLDMSAVYSSGSGFQCAPRCSLKKCNAPPRSPAASLIFATGAFGTSRSLPQGRARKRPFLSFARCPK